MPIHAQFGLYNEAKTWRGQYSYFIVNNYLLMGKMYDEKWEKQVDGILV